MKRYAVYYAPRDGAFAARAAAWLGRDAASGARLPHPVLPGLPDPSAITANPRRYGFHGTIRAPFRPAEAVGRHDIEATVADLARRLHPVVCDGLDLQNLHGFLALTPTGSVAGLRAFAATVVEVTDPLRAQPSAAEIARRRPDALSARQRDLLGLWGYPFVMEEFQFHLTLTDRLYDEQARSVAPVLRDHFAPVLPRPFMIEDLCLFGEDEAGLFHLLHRYALTG